MPDSESRVYVGGDRLRGYGVIRKCRAGYKIGPLFADDVEIAEALFDGLCENVDAGDPVYLDVPEINDAAVEFADRRGMNKVFETARMYTGAPPELDPSRVFGVTTFELG
jgi:hypothetical protein